MSRDPFRFQRATFNPKGKRKFNEYLKDEDEREKFLNELKDEYELNVAYDDHRVHDAIEMDYAFDTAAREWDAAEEAKWPYKNNAIRKKALERADLLAIPQRNKWRKLNQNQDFIQDEDNKTRRAKARERYSNLTIGRARLRYGEDEYRRNERQRKENEEFQMKKDIQRYTVYANLAEKEMLQKAMSREFKLHR